MTQIKDEPLAGTDADPETEASPEALEQDSAEAIGEQVQDEATPSLEVDPQQVARCVEAALLTTDRPLTSQKLSELLGKVGVKAIQAAIAELNRAYKQTGRTFRIEKVADGFQLLTLPEYADVLSVMHRSRQQTKLSPAAMETLAIVAYKQPILRADIEAIRGVACGEVLRSLMDRHLVKIVGRAEELGRPMLYGTTKLFLEVFGLSNLKDLPQVTDLQPPRAMP